MRKVRSSTLSVVEGVEAVGHREFNLGPKFVTEVGREDVATDRIWLSSRYGEPRFGPDASGHASALDGRAAGSPVIRRIVRRAGPGTKPASAAARARCGPPRGPSARSRRSSR